MDFDNLLRRVLKLIQRNQGQQPPKEVFNRWNEWCDLNAPSTTRGGAPTRDPKHFNGEHLMQFLCQLPTGFWVNMIKKVQKDGKEPGLAQAWEDFADDHCAQAGVKATRDPRNMPPEVMVDFVSQMLHHDDREGGHLAMIVDAYSFDFSRTPRPGADAGVGRGGGTRRGERAERTERGGKASGRGKDAATDAEANTLARMVRLLQRGSHAAKRCWDGFCDEHGPRQRGGDAVRDPRRHTAAFLRDFLLAEVSIAGWAVAVEQAIEQAEEMREQWEALADAASRQDQDPWADSGLLLELLEAGVAANLDPVARAVEQAAIEAFGSEEAEAGEESAGTGSGEAGGGGEDAGGGEGAGGAEDVADDAAAAEEAAEEAAGEAGDGLAAAVAAGLAAASAEPQGAEQLAAPGSEDPAAAGSPAAAAEASAAGGDEAAGKDLD